MVLSLKKVLYIIVLIGIIAAASWGAVLPYCPPLLDRGYRNPKEWVFDHLLFTWYYSRGAWMEGIKRKEMALPARARAVWHNPSRSKEFFAIASDDYWGLARLYESLGLGREAALLYSYAFKESAADPDCAREVLLSCAGLSAWEDVEQIAALAAGEDFPEGYYWWGRALIETGGCREAVEKLKIASAAFPPSADLYFQLGRAYQGLGRELPAEAEYRRAVEFSPLHQEAWEALAGLYQGLGLEREAADAATIADDLLPPLRARARFGNELVFLGSSPIPPVIRGGDEFSLTLYYQALPGVKRDLHPLIKLRSPRSGKAVSLAPVLLPSSPGEEYLVAPVKVRVPQEIWPGETEVLIAFLDPEGRLLRIFGERAQELPLFPTTVRPRVFQDSPEDPRLKEVRGQEVIDLRVRTVLSGRSAVTIRSDSETKVSGIGLVSSTLDTVPLPEGTEVARLECRGIDGISYVFPVRLGRETADVHLERWASNITGHSPVEIFSSEVKSISNKEFFAHDYRAQFRFPSPVRLEEIKLIYDYPDRGAWFIKHLCLLPRTEDKSDMDINPGKNNLLLRNFPD